MASGSKLIDKKIWISSAPTGQLQVKLGQRWSKLTKIFECLGFDVKAWKKMLFWEDFDLV